MDTGNISSGPAPESVSQPSTPEPVASGNPTNGQSAEAPNGAGARQGPGGGGRNRRRRNRRRRGGHGGGQNQPKQAHHQQPQNRGSFRGNGQQNRGNVFTGPMDHSYRQSNGEVNGNSTQEQGGRNQRFGRRFRQRFGGRGNQPPMQPAPMPSELLEPVAQSDHVTRIFAFVEDLFFVTKMNETARKLNVKVAFAKTIDELFEKIDAEPEAYKPALIVFDLNNVNAKPLNAIPKLKARFKKSASIMGFVPHVQGDLKVKAIEAGCDTVVPRSAFSQSLPQLLRRYGAPEEQEQV